MPRPEKLEDLPSWQLEEKAFAVITPGSLSFIDDTDVLAHTLALVDACKESVNLTFKERYGTITISIKKTDEEKEAILEQAIRNWDHNEKVYLDAVRDASAFPVERRWVADDFAKKEKLPEIEWPEN